MSYANGLGSRMSLAKKQTTEVPYLVNFRSESINTSVSKTAEDSLMSAKTTSNIQITDKSFSGNVSTYLRDSFADVLFECVLGDKASTGRVFTLSDIDDADVLGTIYVDRKGDVTKYENVKVNSLTLTVPSDGFVSADFDIMALGEATGATFPTISTTGQLSARSYKGVGAVMTFNNGDAMPVQTSTITINNNTSLMPKVYTSGLVADGYQSSVKDVSISWSMPRDTNWDTYRASLSSDDYVAIELAFTDGTHTITIELPNVALDSASAPVGGQGLITASMNGRAVSVGTTEPITITITDNEDDNE